MDSEKFYKKNKKYCVGLVGRVVPVKDIKTFIKAISKVSSKIDDVEFLILGPTDEDLDYFSDCKMLIHQLGLDEVIIFTEKVNLKYYYPSLDLLILSSISEGQPLVLLEGFCFKIPAVTTDVGSCRELIEGSTVADKAIGKAGFVVPFGMPNELADKIIALLSDDKLRLQFGDNAYKRFLTLYQEKYTIQNYVDLYQSYFMDDI